MDSNLEYQHLANNAREFNHRSRQAKAHANGTQDRPTRSSGGRNTRSNGATRRSRSVFINQTPGLNSTQIYATDYLSTSPILSQTHNSYSQQNHHHPAASLHAHHQTIPSSPTVQDYIEHYFTQNNPSIDISEDIIQSVHKRLRAKRRINKIKEKTENQAEKAKNYSRKSKKASCQACTLSETEALKAKTTDKEQKKLRKSKTSSKKLSKTASEQIKTDSDSSSHKKSERKSRSDKKKSTTNSNSKREISQENVSEKVQIYETQQNSQARPRKSKKSEKMAETETTQLADQPRPVEERSAEFQNSAKNSQNLEKIEKQQNPNLSSSQQNNQKDQEQQAKLNHSPKISFSKHRYRGDEFLSPTRNTETDQAVDIRNSRDQHRRGVKPNSILKNDITLLLGPDRQVKVPEKRISQEKLQEDVLPDVESQSPTKLEPHKSSIETLALESDVPILVIGQNQDSDFDTVSVSPSRKIGKLKTPEIFKNGDLPKYMREQADSRKSLTNVSTIETQKLLSSSDRGVDEVASNACKNVTPIIEEFEAQAQAQGQIGGASTKTGHQATGMSKNSQKRGSKIPSGSISANNRSSYSHSNERRASEITRSVSNFSNYSVLSSLDRIEKINNENIKAINASDSNASGRNTPAISNIAVSSLGRYDGREIEVHRSLSRGSVRSGTVGSRSVSRNSSGLGGFGSDFWRFAA